MHFAASWLYFLGRLCPDFHTSRIAAKLPADLVPFVDAGTHNVLDHVAQGKNVQKSTQRFSYTANDSEAEKGFF